MILVVMTHFLTRDTLTIGSIVTVRDVQVKFQQLVTITYVALE